MSLKPWREIARPHKDVLEGTFKQSEFAADITQVANGTATPEYQDAEKFFSRTFITEGIPPLLDQAGITELPNANIAVLDGIALSVSQGKQHGSICANTLWGEMACGSCWAMKVIIWLPPATVMAPRQAKMCWPSYSQNRRLVWC